MSVATVTEFPRPEWCPETGPTPFCDDHGHCMGPEAVVSGTIGEMVKGYDGKRHHCEVRISFSREVGPCRAACLPREDTHSVYVAVAPDGLDSVEGSYTYLTVAQVEELRDVLTEVLRMAAEDRAALLGGARR